MSNTSISVDPPCGLAKILKDNSLEMPPHQREYSWKKEQIERFYQDISTAINKGEDTYFFGSIVGIPGAANDSTQSIQIIDGQQRLSTTAIFLAAVRDYLQSHGETKAAAAINTNYLTGFDFELDESIPKLSLNKVDNDFYRDFIVAEGDGRPKPSRPSHHLLEASFKLAIKKVESIVSQFEAKEHRAALSSWVTFLTNNAVVVMFRASSEANAYKMFETLNDRGLRTSQADLVKNMLFGIAGKRSPEVEEKWSYMRGTLETLDEKNDQTITFLRHALTCKFGAIREEDIYDKSEESSKTSQNAVKYVTYLDSVAHKYVAIRNPEHSLWAGYPAETRKCIETLNLLNLAPVRPIMLAVAKDFDRKQTALSFKFLVSLGVRLLIASSTRSGAIESRLGAAARKIDAKEITSTDELLNDVTKIIPPDEVFQEKFETANSSNTKLSRYYLHTLERQKNRVPNPCLIPSTDPKDVNLEHILPRRPGDNWDRFTEADVKMYGRRLGNMALLQTKINSELKSDGFVDKKEAYKSTPLLTTSEIAKYEDWTVATILERQEKLAKLAVKAWPV